MWFNRTFIGLNVVVIFVVFSKMENNSTLDTFHCQVGVAKVRHWHLPASTVYYILFE